MRYLIIDMDNMKLLGVSDSVMKASMIAWNDHPDVAIRVFGTELKSNWGVLSRMEATLLYKNEIGGDLGIDDFGGMITALHEAAEKLHIDQRSLTTLNQAAENLPENMQATETGFRPLVVRASAEQSYAPRTLTPGEAKPKVERAPREPGAAPSPKGATGKVWAIADEVWEANGKGLIDKVMRTKIVDACVAQGINAATAGTQYSKWKATK